MKNKFMLDILVYMISPIITYSIASSKNINYATIILIGLILFYTFITNKKEARINVSLIYFSISYISISLIKQTTQDEFLKYTYEIYFLMIIAILMLLLRYINKNIVKQIYIDILKLSKYSISSIFNILKNKSMIQQFEKTYLIFTIHLLCIVLLRIYTISVYGSENYIATKDFEILTNIFFIIVEVYMICITMQIHKTNKIYKDKSKKNSITTMNLINKKESNKVVYLSKYKRTNK